MYKSPVGATHALRFRRHLRSSISGRTVWFYKQEAPLGNVIKLRNNYLKNKGLQALLLEYHLQNHASNPYVISKCKNH